MWGFMYGHHSFERNKRIEQFNKSFQITEEEMVDKYGEVALNCLHPFAVEQYAYKCKWCSEFNNVGIECLDCRKELYI